MAGLKLTVIHKDKISRRFKPDHEGQFYPDQMPQPADRDEVCATVPVAPYTCNCNATVVFLNEYTVSHTLFQDVAEDVLAALPSYLCPISPKARL